ncbi:MAG: MFS transporter [Georgenia sp.]
MRRRSTATLLVGQVLGSFGIGAAPSVGILLAASVADSETWAGIARAATTVGAALIALPLAALAARHGRGRALALGWSLAAAGAALLVTAAVTGSVPLLVLGMLATGAGSATQLQARFAATDLAEPAHRARSLSLVMWVGTIGAVLGPNLGAPGEVVAARLGLPPLGGAFVLSAVLLALTAGVVLAGLRPDPLLLAQRHTAAAARVVVPHAEGTGRDATGPAATRAEATGAEPTVAGPTVAGPTGTGQRPPARGGVREALRLVRATPAGRFALLALVLAHVSMVSVMTMTPVHLSHQGGTVTVIGLTISLHVLGMFALAPVVGVAADRYGRVPVIVAGQGVLAAAAVVGALGADSTAAVAVALTLLGLGWSVVTVPASALLTQAVPTEARPLVQGLGDTAMNGAAALGAIASGPLMAVLGFSALATLAGVVVVPVLWLAWRTARRAE